MSLKDKWHACELYFCHKKAHAKRLFRWARERERERRKWEGEREREESERKKGRVEGVRKREWESENLRVSGDLAEGRNRKLVLHYIFYIYTYKKDIHYISCYNGAVSIAVMVAGLQILTSVLPGRPSPSHYSFGWLRSLYVLSSTCDRARGDYFSQRSHNIVLLIFLKQIEWNRMTFEFQAWGLDCRLV